MDADDEYTIDCTEEEFFELTERLLDNDENNCARYIGYDLQDRREGDRDVSEDPLFYDVDDALFEIPTVAKLIALHDNYEVVGTRNEFRCFFFFSISFCDLSTLTRLKK